MQSSLITNDPQAWLDTYATPRFSDIVLGVITLLVGTLFLWNVPDSYDVAAFLAEYPTDIGFWFFPSVAAYALCVIGSVLLIRATLLRSPAVKSYRIIHLAVIFALLVALVFVSLTLLQRYGLRFGPQEFMAFLMLLLALAVLLSHSSRTRALGMLFLGLLLTTIGMDTNAGLERFTMRMEELLEGINPVIVFVGLFVVGDSIVCLRSVPLFMCTYTRLIAGGHILRISRAASFIMRFAGVVILFCMPFFAYGISENYVDIILIFIFGVMGVAAKIFGWNRFILYLGFTYGARLEESIQSVSQMNGAHLGDLFRSYISGGLLVTTLLVLMSGIMLSVRRAKVVRFQSL